MINIQKFMSDYTEMMKNPKQYVMKNMGISEDIANDPNRIIQQLMNEGKVTQEQYNAARMTATQLQQILR